MGRLAQNPQIESGGARMPSPAGLETFSATADEGVRPMSTENVTLVRAAHDALAMGDIPGFFGTLSADVDWTHQDGLPCSGTHHGLEAMNDVVRLWMETSEEMRVIPEEFIDGGDTIVVVGRYDVRTKAGAEVATWFVPVFEITEGTISRFPDFTDKALILAAVTAGAAP
jgi:ketosteroid isomerase-like protein